MSEIIKYLLVGNGPSATFFIDPFVRNKEKIFVVNASNLNINTSFPYINYVQNINTPWKFLKKNSGEINFSNNNFFNYENFSTGGLSNTWGGGNAKLSKEDIGVNENFFLGINKNYNYIAKKIGVHYEGSDDLDSYLGIFPKKFKKPVINELKKFNFKSDKKNLFGITRKAIMYGDNQCNFCGGCNIYCFNRSLYNSEFNFKENQFVNFFNNFKLDSFCKKDDLYQVNIISKNNEKKTLLVKNLIIAAGTYSTTKILLRYLSDLKLVSKNQRIQYLHNPLIRAVFLKFKKKFNLPSGIFVLKSLISQKKNFYTSFIFGENVPTTDLMTFFFIKNNFIRSVINFLKSNLLITFSFFPSEYSKTFVTLSKQNELKFTSQKKNLNFIYFKYLIFMIKKGYIPLFFSKMLNGSDLHHGGTFPVGNEKDLNVNQDCELNGHKNLYLIDGSWMPKISEKPHTFALMSNAIRVAETIIKKNKNE